VIKEIQWSDNQVTPQQVPGSNHDLRPQKLHLLDNPELEPEVKAKRTTDRTPDYRVSMNVVPGDLYERLGLRIPRWLLWMLTVFLGTVLSSLMVSSLALWTPLWSNLDRANDEDLGLPSQDQVKVPGDLSQKLGQYKLSRPMNILVMGIEPVQGVVDGSPASLVGKSDTILLVRFDPSDRSIHVLSIPRDTMIAVPGEGLTKVADANAQGGPVLSARVVSRTLNNAPIDRYIRISTSSLRQLVDELGGIDVFVPKDINEQDSAGLSINLVRGWQTLNGEQVEQFTNYREPGLGDLSRVQRQQTLVAALLQRLNSPTVSPRLPQITRVMRKYFDTNLRTEELMALANFSLKVEPDKFRMSMLPGTFSKFSQDPNSYWLNMAGQQNLLRDYAGVIVPETQSEIKPIYQLKIAIQNASNQPLLTEKVISYLKNKGFSQVYPVPDWPDTQRQTQIIVRQGSRELGLSLNKVLGLGQIEVSSAGDLESNLTIRIGKDWK